jgi:hypothetical protein
MVLPEPLDCAEFEALAVLYAAGEMEEPARRAVETHAHICPSCAAVLKREEKLCDAFASLGPAAGVPDGSDFLLARCRSELSETLDDAADRRRRGWREMWRPRNWAVRFRGSVEFHPAWSVAALVLVGVLAGLAGREGYGSGLLQQPGQPVMTISSTPPVSDQLLETMGIEGLSWEPRENASPQVELQLRAGRPMVLRGSPEDTDIRRVLAYVLENGSRFNPGVRLDSLELLRRHVTDPRVSGALRQAAQRDPNPAVRLQALESLRDLGADPDVRETLLQALARDENSGVRIEAVNGLLATLGAAPLPPSSPDVEALQILRDRMRNDPNKYVRLRSATALAQLVSARAEAAPELLGGGPQP